MQKRTFARRSICSILVISVTVMSCSLTSERSVEVNPQGSEIRTGEYVLVATQPDGTVFHFDEPGGVVDFPQPGPAVIRGTIDGHDVVIDLELVERVWLRRVERDGAKSALAVTLGVVVVLGVLVLVALATKESCPFVYSWDGERFVFDAEPYGGATTQGLERDDYSELEHLREVDGAYRFKVTNEVRETQHTNLLELWVVDHPVGSELAVDESGNVYSIQDREPPIRARNSEGKDLTEWLSATDELIWEPMPGSIPTPDYRETIEIAFARPQSADRMKLVVRAATGQWGSHMIRKFLELYGDGVEEWYDQVDHNPRMRALVHYWASSQELYRLKVEVLVNGRWEARGTIPGGGPFISENRVVTLDISDVDGSEVRIRMRPPLGFWALDSFAADFEENQKFHIHKLSPRWARASTGEDVLEQLLTVDDRYFTMPRIGDSGEVVFDAPLRDTAMERTVFLHARGYYRLHLEPGHEPDHDRLKEIIYVDGASARYAETLYREYLRKMAEAATTGSAGGQR